MNQDQITIAYAVHQAARALGDTSPTARLDAELLLAYVLGWRRARVLAESRHPLNNAQYAEFCALIARRLDLEPVAYLTGQREFYGLDFFVSPAVLVPRPETEHLVELALAAARRRNQPVIADIGTGSGCIIVALAVHLPHARFYATDISSAALEVAERNLARHAVADRVQLLQGNLLAPLPEPVDLLASNPPYTLLSEIDENVRRHEPHLALDGGADGLEVYRRLLASAPGKVRSNGAMLLEIGATQGAAVVELAQAHFPPAQISLHQDLAGLDRVVVIDLGTTA